MIISSAMINGKNVLEMKLNNVVVYSAAAPINYNYSFVFYPTNTTPTWLDRSKLAAYGNQYYYFTVNSGNYLLTNYNSSANIIQIGYLGMDLSQCTKDLKITVVYTNAVNTNGRGDRAEVLFGYGPTLTNMTTTVGTIVDANGYLYNITATYTIPISVINAINSGGYVAQLLFRHTNGTMSNNGSAMRVSSIQFTEV